MNLSNTSEIQKKGIFFAAIFLFILIVLFLVLSFKSNTSTKSSSHQISTATTSSSSNMNPTTIDKKIPSLNDTGNDSPTPTYVPPSTAKYSTVDAINFIPNKINQFQINPTKIAQSAKKMYPNLSAKPLEDMINKTLFTWLSLNKFYEDQKKPKQLTATYSKAKVEDLSIIVKETQELEKSYVPNIISMDGIFMKIRFVGVVPTNLEKLHQTEDNLQPIARQLIEQFHNEAVKASNEQLVLDKFNKNTTVQLLNNREVSVAFKNYSLFPPLVSDVNYLALMQSLPVAKVSDVFPLRAKINGKVTPYGFVVFYISKKTGTYQSLEMLANSYVENSKIE